MTGLPLLDLMHAPPVRMPVDPSGQVLQEEPDEVLLLPHRRMAWPEARIALHLDRVRDLWMWSVSFATQSRGHSYRVGAKWGKFAVTRADALHWARTELLGYLNTGSDTPATRRIRIWAEALS